jgi:YHS domain-containing protein
VIRQLFLVVVVGALMWWLRKLARRMQPQQAGRPVDGHPHTEPIRDLGPMVRDHVCNTFLPKSRALSARVDSDEHYFCSEECREKFLAERPVHSA